ncbi:MAG: hypothetical protein WBE80_17915, partial [Methylocella sp.]
MSHVKNFCSVDGREKFTLAGVAIVFWAKSFVQFDEKQAWRGLAALEPDSKDNYRASRLTAIWMQASVT